MAPKAQKLLQQLNSLGKIQGLGGRGIHQHDQPPQRILSGGTLNLHPRHRHRTAAQAVKMALEIPGVNRQVGRWRVPRLVDLQGGHCADLPI